MAGSVSDLRTSKTSPTSLTSMPTSSHKTKEQTTKKEQSAGVESNLFSTSMFRKLDRANANCNAGINSSNLKRSDVEDQPQNSKTEETVAKKKRTRKPHAVQWKKPKGMPKRPLSAYNYFFRREREEMMKTASIEDNTQEDGMNENKRRRKTKANTRAHIKSSGLGFANLAKTVGTKWKSLDDDTRKIFDSLARVDKERYKNELAVWRSQHENAKSSHGVVLKSAIKNDINAQAIPVAFVECVSDPKEKISISINRGAPEPRTKKHYGPKARGGKENQDEELFLEDNNLAPSNSETKISTRRKSIDIQAAAPPSKAFISLDKDTLTESNSFDDPLNGGSLGSAPSHHEISWEYRESSPGPHNHGDIQGIHSSLNNTQWISSHSPKLKLKNNSLSSSKSYTRMKIDSNASLPNCVLHHNFHEDTLQLRTLQQTAGCVGYPEYWSEHPGLGDIRRVEELQAASYKLLNQRKGVQTPNASSIQILVSQLDDDAADFLTSLKYDLS